MISNLFSTNRPITKSASPTDVRLADETFTEWGCRWAGASGATNAALATSLQSIYTQEKHAHGLDEQMQNRLKKQKENELSQLEADRQISHNNKEALLHQNDRLADLIEELKQQKNDIKGETNEKQVARIHFFIGLFICIALAIYLFVFYCSASFSAFFRTQNTFDESTNTIFYPYAIRDAFDQGFLSVLLIFLLPVVFLGLGFIIHQFSQQNGVVKYLKIGALYLITFIFDSIIAYEISEKVYNYLALQSPYEMDPYSFKLAFTEPGFWIIIFAGFIAYVIWGMVFDFTMDSYSNMTSNATALKKINDQIEDKKQKLETNHQQITDLENDIAKQTEKILALQRSIDNGETLVDLNRIKNSLSQFFNGWVTIMPLIGQKDNLSEAQRIYENFCKSLG